jgi:Rieske Fe-S protein
MHPARSASVVPSRRSDVRAAGVIPCAAERRRERERRGDRLRRSDLREGKIFVFQKSPGTYVALPSSCTHQCCTLTYSGGELLCPCDGATFDLTGATTSGKTSVNLAVLTVCSDASGVTVSW